MRDLKRKVKVNGEIVVGFTGKVGSQHKKTFGLADSNYVLIGICQRPYSHVIIHEVGHVFGADDRPDSSVMSSQGFSYTYDFSVQDREIITRLLARFLKES
jgi:DNA topoisomerase IB